MPRTNAAWVGVGLCVLMAACIQPEPSKRGSEPRQEPPRSEQAPAGPGSAGLGSAGLEFVPPEPGTYDLPAIQAAADGRVVDADGTARQLFDYMGDRYVLLSFIYTRCSNPKGCPLATSTLDRIETSLEAEPELAASTRLVTLSFDPERDTPESMLRYAARDYSDTEWKERPWSFLTTASWAELQPILDGYGQYVVREVDEKGTETGDYSHLMKVFLIDRERRVRNIYSSEFIHPVTAINDLKTLLVSDSTPG